jgi:bifunctional non-homologous end joining protein LigD
MIHRMDPLPDGWTPIPQDVAPMLATPAIKLPPDDDAWGYEMDWAGLRVFCYVDGGRARFGDVTELFPELRPLGEKLAPIECVLDGSIVAFDGDSRVAADALEPRLKASGGTAIRRLASQKPVQYLVTDLLWLDGTSTVDFPYTQRRELLDGMGLEGPRWQTPPYFPGGGTFALQASREQGLPGVLAKRLDSPYLPGKRTRRWLSVKPRGRAGRP